MLLLNNNTPEGQKGTRYKIKGDVSGDRGILSKPTIRHPVGGGMSHSTVC